MLIGIYSTRDSLSVNRANYLLVFQEKKKKKRQSTFPSIPIGRNSRHYQVMFGSGALMGFIVHNSHKQGAVQNPHVERDKMMNTIPAITFSSVPSQKCRQATNAHESVCAHSYIEKQHCQKFLSSLRFQPSLDLSFFLTKCTFLRWHQKESKVVEEVLSRERNSQSTICLFQVISNSYTQGQDCVDPPLHLRPCTVPVDGSNSERARLSNSRWSCSYKGGKRATHFL